MLIQKAQGDDLRRIADSLEPRLRREFLAAFDQLKQTIPVNQITDLLEQGKMGELLTLVEGMKVSSVVAIEAVMIDIATKAAEVTADAYELSFTIKNPQVEKWAAEHTTAAIKEMDAATRRTVTDIVTGGFRDGMAPREQARLIKDVVGLTERQADSVRLFKLGLKESGFTSAQIEAQGEKMAARLIKQRATQIARTESINAANRGQLQTWIDNINSGLLPQTVRRVWIASGDERVCPICAVLDGKTVGFDVVGGDGFELVNRATPNPFTSSVQAVGLKPGQKYVEGVTPTKQLKHPIETDAPTAHVQCRCGVGLVFD